MGKDYILFLHGVNVRESKENEKNHNYTYADKLFKSIVDLVQQKGGNRECVKVPLYWGDVNESALNELLTNLKGSSKWNQLWFQDFRQKQILQFVGDGGLYISRLIGSMAAEQLKNQTFKGLEKYGQDDRLHLVTHSWGTIILFDILFASRWDNQDIPGYQSVKDIRDKLYGIGDNLTTGIRLASIQTMGSPIALFSLITINGRNSNDESTHDISPGLSNLLKNLTQGGQELCWLNFIHPGDPIAWPLENLIAKLIPDSGSYVDVKDVLTGDSGLLNLFAQTPPIRQTFLALANGGSAHGSYWQNKDVAQQIAANILKV